MDRVKRFSKKREEMIWDLEEAKLAIQDKEKKKHLFPLDSGIPNFLLIKLLSDLDRKIQRLSRIYSGRIISGPPNGQAVKKCSTMPNAEHLSHCCACWRKVLDWSEISSIAPGFSEGQMREFEDGLVGEGVFLHCWEGGLRVA